MLEIPEELFVAPASFAQERLWLLDRIDPGSSAYNVPLALRIAGDLDVERLRAALGELVERHESLRTALGQGEEGEPVQLIAPSIEVELPVLDHSAAVVAEAQRPFDLEKIPLWRAVLYRTGEREHLLLLTFHHSIVDAPSLGILVRELFAFYAGRGDELPELAIQYADFAEWQRQWLQGETLERKLYPWRQKLAGAPASLALPFDRPAGRPGAPQAGVLSFALPAQVRLRAFARDSGITLFTAVLAGFDALLFRHTGQGDLVVGTPVANRDRKETEGVVGLFLNTLALRVEAGDDPSFRDLVARVREAMTQALAQADVPFEKLVSELRPERRADQTPLFQVLLAFQQPTVPSFAAAGLSVAAVEIYPGQTKFDLTLHVVDGEEIGGSWEYPTERFDPTTISRLAAHFETLLREAVAHPERRLSELKLLTAAERHQTTVEWSGDLPPAAEPGLLVHELFLRQAERTPEALAVVSGAQGEETLTYRQLRHRAGRLARRLRRLGVGPEVRVGIAVGRTPDLAVAVLGILLAGGAYVPLDPEYPRHRLELMLKDSGIAALVAHPALLDRLPETSVPVLLAGEEEKETEGTEDLASGAGPDDRVYVLYTSGSTGRPKGVAMTHRALTNLIAWQLGAPGGRGLLPGAATLQFAPLAFDASFQELFATWAAGGTLVLIPDEMRREPEELLARLDRFRVARIFVPAVALQQLAQAAERIAPPRGLREVVTAGEQLQITPPVRSLFARLPGASLHNQYGPTEAHVVTALTLPPGPAEWPALPAIGRPIAGARVFLLDRGLEPVPAGVVGRLFLGGVGLSRGYHGRPDWTAERFLPSPFAGLSDMPEMPETPGERLYDTGDLARFRADGTIELLGRADQQVKVRGFRVEPGEVEAALAEHPGVTASAVAARPGPAGDLRLVAWVVPGRPAPPVRELRDFLAARLPAPLVPAAWVEIAALPRTPSGKVDRAALPDPPPEAAPAAAPLPLTPVEEVLAGIWAGILRLPAIGPDDNFFDLGGHSLTATTVTSQARQVFQVELPTRALFESPTLRELAERIEQLLHAEEGLELPPITPAPRSAAGMPLSFAQQRLWFLDELSGGETPFYNIAAALPLDGRLDPRAMAAAVAGIVARHEALRTTFAAGADGRPVQAIHPPFRIPLPVTDLRGLPRDNAEAEALRLAREEAGRPFSLAKGPLLRIGLLRLADERQVLTLTFHHIVADGWSLAVFVREWGLLYGAAFAGRHGELPPLPVQYADFALWQQRWLAGPALDAQLGYWRGDLAGAPLVLDLPTDRPRPPLQTYPGRNLRLPLSAALTAELRAVARENRATLFMVLLAPFAALLSRASGQTDVLIGSPIANRNRAEVLGIFGCFVNMLVLRADLSRRPTWSQLLARVRETALSAYTHQDFPFERLVEELQPARDLSRNPLFQASFAMASTPWHELDLPGLSLGTLPGIDEGPELELFDLTLQIFETPQGLNASLSWNADLFDETTLRRLAGHLETLLADLAHRAERPRAPISEVPLLGPGERHQLLVEWAGEPFASAPASLLPLLAVRVRHQPAAPALLWEDGELAYEELDRRSNRLARRLASLGVGPEAIVGLRLAGGADFVTAALAVWKAGGAYLPVDPQLPSERQAFLLKDSGARALVTRASLAGPLPDLPTLRLDTDRAALAAESAAALPDLPLALSAAYVIYTSGSTGRPKGVVVPHGALAGHALEFTRWLGLRPEDRVLQLTSFSFDVSVDEIFPTLVAGAALVPWRPEVADPQGLAGALREGEITVVNLTTALWHQAARAWAEEAVPALPHLRAVLVGGEAIPPGALRLWQRTPFADVPLLHGYGLTETVVTSTLHCGQGGRDLGTLSVGRPLAGRALYLLGAAGDPVLLGAVGEVHLGEPALARGYLGRPDSTAAAFVPDPWGPPGARLYRTGDLARYRPDGTLEILGRRDRQVKVRGFRIELGEVEATLLAHPALREAAVIRREGGIGPQGEGGPEYGSLVAYLVGASGPPPAAAELRAFLAGRLPSYMVPGAFVELPALPRTAGGKVDRRALDAPAPPPPRIDAPPSSDPIEARLADLWRELLEVEEVRPDDNFFELGGHSMLLTVLRVRLQQEWGVELSVIEMFEHPTVASLARRLRGEEGLALPQPAAESAPIGA